MEKVKVALLAIIAALLVGIVVQLHTSMWSIEMRVQNIEYGINALNATVRTMCADQMGWQHDVAPSYRYEEYLKPRPKTQVKAFKAIVDEELIVIRKGDIIPYVSNIDIPRP